MAQREAAGQVWEVRGRAAMRERQQRGADNVGRVATPGGQRGEGSRAVAWGGQQRGENSNAGKTVTRVDGVGRTAT